MKSHRQSIQIPGLEVAANIWGPEDGRPVLALHGWLDNAASFDALIPRLGGGLRVVAIDLPGHGQSDWRADSEAYHFIDWVDVVLQTADALGWERFSILGHSMGAAIASLTAPVAPKRVDKMVFVDAIGPWSEPASGVVEQLRGARGEESVLRARPEPTYGSMDAMVQALSRDRPEVPDARLRLLAERAGLRGDDGRWRFSNDPRLKAASRVRLTEGQVMQFLSEIACPVLLVRPRQGWPIEEAVVERRLGAIDDLKVVRVDGGHHVHLEAPEVLADEVGRFLRNHSSNH